ncbi:MAG: 4Fe-4S dicluster domain-containing protein [Caldilineaceae bacterium]
MNRLYVVESSLSTTGSVADHRLGLRPGQIESFARALAAAVGVDAGPVTMSGEWSTAWFNTVVADLQSHSGNCVVVAGPQQPPAVHALAHAINAALNAAGSTVTYTAPVVANQAVQAEQMAELVQEMNSGAVEALFILGGNPVFNAPADMGFADALAQVAFSTHLSPYVDETSSVTTWHVPQTHFIEEWSDARAFDGTASLVQPPIGPLYDTVRSAHEVVALLAGDSRSGYEILRDYWQGQAADGFEAFWNRALQSGVVNGTAFEPVQPTLVASLADVLPAAQQGSDGLELVFRPDYTLWDGRFAANSWLLELPDPITKISWDNVAVMSAATAADLGVQSEDMVELVVANRSVNAPVWVMPGQPDGVVSVSLGYGRSAGAEVAQGVGFNPYLLRTADNPWFAQGLDVRPLGQQYTIATTQTHYPMQSGEHPAVRVTTLADFKEDPHFIHEEKLKSLLPDWEYDGYAWGMAIDLTTCIGCNACVLSCQTENNIPSVGKEQVEIGREMYWLRIDRYFDGEDGSPQVYFQPVPCMHCENAPCELVCPVAATVHSDEGLNQMVYNRCIGTRYCSNNCPYKVRRFNFLNYIEEAPILGELRNPDVTVRPKGVMEKCTYCVQRINRAHVESKKENRSIFDGEVVPACASACPTKAIVFGDINDVNAEVSQWKSQPQNYGLLAELNTRPRTTYLARFYNSNIALELSEAEG